MLGGCFFGKKFFSPKTLFFTTKKKYLQKKEKKASSTDPKTVFSRISLFPPKNSHMGPTTLTKKENFFFQNKQSSCLLE